MDTPKCDPRTCDHKPKRGSAAQVGECTECGTNEHEAAAFGEPFYRHMHDFVLTDGDPWGRCVCGATFLRSWLVEQRQDAERVRSKRLALFAEVAS